MLIFPPRLERSGSTRRAPHVVSVTLRLVRVRTCASPARTSGTSTARGTRLQLESGLVSGEEREGFKGKVVYYFLSFCIIYSDSDASSEDSQSRSRTHSITTPSPTGACTSSVVLACILCAMIM